MCQMAFDEKSQPSVLLECFWIHHRTLQCLNQAYPVALTLICYPSEPYRFISSNSVLERVGGTSPRLTLVD